ncbi:YoaK family protein [Pseudomonas helleri]|uniref:YoaK family protein n=1 Tax=Pseudomonas helleri TaxID=1608996 RepID=UPI000652E25E|nr:YoaK family protein [Pseudomonas helleri]KMN08744.1 membrane protein [Pseudomonas helleri]
MSRGPLETSKTSPFVRVRALRNRVGLTFVACLSVLAGMTDAIGFLAVGDFISFMSGNTTRLAVAIAQGDTQVILRLGFAVLAFVAGNALGVVFARWGGRRALPLMLLISALLCTAALLPLQSQVTILLTAVLAMGMVNAAVEQVNGLQVGLTYVTGALSRFGRSLGRWILGERRPNWHLQVVPWTGMLAGAVAGAALESQFGIRALLFSAGLAAFLGLVSLKIPRSWQRDYMPR